MPDLRPQILLIILSLLLVGISFWAGSDLLTKQLLALSYRTVDKLQADQLTQVLINMNFTVIDTQIQQEQKFTQVNIKIGDSVLKRIELEFPDANVPEVAIAKTFGLYPQLKKLEPNQPIQVTIPVTLKVIKAEIEKEQGLTFVEVITANNSLKKLNFVFPVTEISMVETLAAQILNLSSEDVRKLIRYQVRKL
ncbi:hypothetical protein [Anabaena subtropica]|uniref:Uncharacterized protein n=1 Tax=Anabaena subtropica FACHB-260 TaxID=2692884 RepID=A0ABR8CS82_9NOST|nr:hypothetical protein [Anabaena subtropica]MBD2346060.1 hypothetical protein [Anabaena subtropica FACHB-260]